MYNAAEFIATGGSIWCQRVSFRFSFMTVPI
jgi:hypothetical protein